MKRILYVVTEDWYFCSHRLPLAQAALAAGYDGAVATRRGGDAHRIVAAGIAVHALEFSRRSQNPLAALRAVMQLRRLYRAQRPDIVHHVALKPVLFGSLAARLARVPAVVNAIAGLGYVFSSRDLRARLLRPAVELAYRLLLRGRGRRVILQNDDDLALLGRRGVIPLPQTVVIRGSGVDTARFAQVPEPGGTPLVVLPARLLRDKGVVEFVEAARLLRSRGVAARFALVGDTDPDNPASIEPARVRQWRADGAVECWGWRDDMHVVFAQSAIVCLPSWREGLPKALIEAAAVGRPIVTCDVPGCRDVVRHQDNGLLVPPRAPAALAAALARLLADPAGRARMGARGRARALAEFSVEQVIERTLALYAQLDARG